MNQAPTKKINNGDCHHFKGIGVGPIKMVYFLGIGAWHHFIFSPYKYYFFMRVEALGKTSIAFKTTASLFR
jgi:hypothetical protein